MARTAGKQLFEWHRYRKFRHWRRHLVSNLLYCLDKHLLRNMQELGDTMLQELMMEKVWISVPFLVLSTEVHLRGPVEKHLLTPFGYVDISFPGLGYEQQCAGSPYEVTVVGDFESWRLDESGPIEFREYLLNFVRKIVETYLYGSTMNPLQLRIHLTSGDLDLVCPVRTQGGYPGANEERIN